jgi:hypothetical protein
VHDRDQATPTDISRQAAQAHPQLKKADDMGSLPGHKNSERFDQLPALQRRFLHHPLRERGAAYALA